MVYTNLNSVSIRNVFMIIIERKQKGETKITLPNWVAALVVVLLIFVVAMIVVKYYSAIVLWLR